MPVFDAHVFESQAAILALEKYTAVARLNVRIYGPDKSLISRPVGRNPLFELFGTAYEPHILVECVERCFSQSGPYAKVCVEHEHGIGVVAAPLAYAGEVACVAVASYALTSHMDQLQVRRLARETDDS